MSLGWIGFILSLIGLAVFMVVVAVVVMGLQAICGVGGLLSVFFSAAKDR